MESIKFLKERLQDLSGKLPYLNIRYEYREVIDTHIIEVIPLSYFNNDDQYIQLQIDLEESFEKKFPQEEIIFVSEDSLTEVNSPILELGLSTIKVEIPLFEFDKMTFEDETLWQSLRSYFDYMISDYQRTSHIDNSYLKCMPTMTSNNLNSHLSDIWKDVNIVSEELDTEKWNNNTKIYSGTCPEFFFTNIAA